MDNSSKAAQLKEAGNKLYLQQDYAGAAVQYTEAITLDPRNAILYANRAACYLALRKYLDAAADAKKATELDLLYSKAWARLATAHDALSETNGSVKAWQRAINTLPKENLTPAELKQKEQYEDGLKAALLAKRKAKSESPETIHIPKGSHKFPWTIAVEMRPGLERARERMISSSAWVILGAYEEFSEGVRNMGLLKRVGPAYFGMAGVLESLTNGIMRDERVFHIDDPEWITKYNKQAGFEAQKRNAWVEGGPELIIKEARERLRREGWSSVRPALSTTIRGYIMRGFVEGTARGNHTTEVEMLTRSIEILEWGQREWSSVSKEDRGAIFEDTFIRGVRSMRLEALMHGYTTNPGPGSLFPLQGLLDSADALIEEINAHPLDRHVPVDPGFISSFVIYPRANALAMKGYYHRETAKLCGPNDVREHLHKAAQFYEQAALILPEDDEKHAFFLNTALRHYFNCGTPLRKTLPIIGHIKQAIPKMSKIWSSSQLALQGGHDGVKQVFEMEQTALEGLESGKFTMDDAVTLQFEKL